VQKLAMPWMGGLPMAATESGESFGASKHVRTPPRGFVILIMPAQKLAGTR
jgi:hypothetical protein